MLKRPFNQHTPPPHPNWTGRAYRTTDEAFGCRRYYTPEPRPERRLWWLVAVAVMIVIVAVLASPETTWLPQTD